MEAKVRILVVEHNVLPSSPSRDQNDKARGHMKVKILFSVVEALRVVCGGHILLMGRYVLSGLLCRRQYVEAKVYILVVEDNVLPGLHTQDQNEKARGHMKVKMLFSLL